MAAQQQLKPAHDTGVGKGAVGPVPVIILALVFLALTIGLLFTVWLLWPPTPTTDDAGDIVPIVSYGPFNWNVEQNMLLLIAILGALGSMGYVLRSYAKYVGERILLWSWVPLYFLTPALAAVVSTATYIVLRAGLLGTPTGTSDGTDTIGNTWGFAAIAILVGLFAAQASSKLKQVFEAVFTGQEAGGETAGQKGAASKDGPSITEIPAEARVGEQIIVKGVGIDKVEKVTFGGGATGDATFDTDLGALVVTVPGLAEDGPLSVKIGDETVTSTTDFKVTR